MTAVHVVTAALLVVAAVVVLALVVIMMTVAIRRQVLLWRMQRWAAWYWENARLMDAEGKTLGYRSKTAEKFRAQADHLDRHIRVAMRRNR